MGPWGIILVADLADHSRLSHLPFFFSQVNLFRQGELAGARNARMMPETP